MKTKTLLAAVLLAISGIASAEISMYNPINLPPEGYEQGCEYSYFKLWSSSDYFDIPQLRNGESFYVYPSFDRPYLITCSYGLVTADAESNVAALFYYYE